MSNSKRKLKSMDIYWFSGTGNSLVIAKTFSEKLSANGIETTLYSLPCPAPNPDNFSLDKAIAVIFPVYQQSAPTFISDWLQSFPDGNNTPVVIISTMAMMSGLVKVPMYTLLKQKGYLPLTVAEIIMPSNFIISTPDFFNKFLVRKAIKRTTKFAKRIVEGKATWPWRPSFLNKLYSKAVVSARTFNGSFSSKFSTVSDCVRCGLCVDLCPTGNIQISNDEVKWGDKCVICLRCIHFCPHQAVKNRSRLLVKCRYTAENINASDLKKQAGSTTK